MPSSSLGVTHIEGTLRFAYTHAVVVLKSIGDEYHDLRILCLTRSFARILEYAQEDMEAAARIPVPLPDGSNAGDVEQKAYQHMRMEAEVHGLRPSERVVKAAEILSDAAFALHRVGRGVEAEEIRHWAEDAMDSAMADAAVEEYVARTVAAPGARFSTEEATEMHMRGMR